MMVLNGIAQNRGLHESVLVNFTLGLPTEGGTWRTKQSYPFFWINQKFLPIQLMLRPKDIWIAAAAFQHGYKLFTKDKQFNFIQGLFQMNTLGWVKEFGNGIELSRIKI
jgi:hypothetical protein